MPKTKISEFSATPGNNTDIDGINLAEGCAPSGINDAIRELMAQLKDFQAGTAGDSFNGPVGTTTPAAGAFTSLSASGTFALTGDQVQISEGGTGQTTANAAFNALAPSQTSNAGKYLKTDGTNTSWDALDISTADITGTLPVANGGTGVTSSTGTGSVVLSASPTFTGTVNGASLTLSSNFTLSGGTANGIAYLNGSKALTTGSALTYSGGTFANDGAADGTNAITATGNTVGGFIALRPDGTNGQAIRIGGSGAGSNILRFLGAADAEYMRLTSSGLEVKQSQLIGYSSYAGIGTNGLAVAGNVGIGTSSPGVKLDVSGADGVRSRVIATSGGTPGLILSSSGNTAYTIKAGNADNSLRIDQDGTDRLTLASGGNLGLGVTPATGGYGRLLQVSDGAYGGAITAQAIDTNYYPVNLTANAVSSGAYTWKYANGASSSATRYEQVSGKHQWFTAPSGTAGNTISFTQAMTLSASGGLSVGSTSDAGTGNILLNANGRLCGNAPSGGTSSTIELYNSSTGNMSLTAAFSGAAITFATGGTTERARISSDGTFRVKGAGTAGSTDAVQFAGSAPASAMTLNSSGNLLVGGTTDSTRLVVTGNGSANVSTFVSPTGGTGAKFAIYSVGGGIGTEVGSVSYNGSTGVNYNTTSDYRLKTLIAKVADAGSRIDALNPVEYEWTANGKRARGFFAHEFQEVYADSVTGQKDAVDEEGKPVYQSMQASSSEVIADLVAEIQSLRARVAALETK